MALDRSNWGEPYTQEQLNEMNHAIEKMNLRDRIEELESVLRQAKDALVMNIVGTSGRTPASHDAIAKINEVLK